MVAVIIPVFLKSAELEVRGQCVGWVAWGVSETEEQGRARIFEKGGARLCAAHVRELDVQQAQTWEGRVCADRMEVDPIHPALSVCAATAPRAQPVDPLLDVDPREEHPQGVTGRRLRARCAWRSMRAPAAWSRDGGGASRAHRFQWRPRQQRGEWANQLMLLPPSFPARAASWAGQLASGPLPAPSAPFLYACASSCPCADFQRLGGLAGRHQPLKDLIGNHGRMRTNGERTACSHTGAQHIFAGGSAAASGAWLLQRRCQARRFVLQHGWGSAVPAALPRAGSERHISVASSGEQLRSAPGDVGCRRATGHTDSSPCPPPAGLLLHPWLLCNVGDPAWCPYKAQCLLRYALGGPYPANARPKPR